MILTKFSFRRSIWSYAKVRRAVGVFLRNRPSQLARLRSDYVNIGCGPYPLKGFCNIDYWWQPGVGAFDISKGIPLPDASVQGIFSEHCLEYLKPEALERVLRDFRRMLRPGGVARITLPDPELYCRLYLQALSGEPVTWPYPEAGKPPIHYVNRVISGWAHYTGFVYDFQSLRDMMLQAGFREVTREAYRQGRDPKLLVEHEWRAVESLYAEGVA
ncbi:MAG: methyltransferase domain-containing protein [Acidobacteriia bacterium]|nr:methyltransferase domain-containing protein [Terriglobia bacterium]